MSLSVPTVRALKMATKCLAGSLRVPMISVSSHYPEISYAITLVLAITTGQGALAQFVRVPAQYLVIRPQSVTPAQAAGLSLAGLTAYQTLHILADIEAGETVFINGGSTAVGAFAIQIAKAAGAKVVATASTSNEGFVRGLGADEFIDYSKVNLAKYLVEMAPSPKFRVVFDTVGSMDTTLYTSSGAYLAPNGVFVTTGPTPLAGSIYELWRMLKIFIAVLTPRWLGGTKHEYRRVHIMFIRQN